ncbi:MAG TPA: hypothetical protein ENJ64_03870, partial [Thiotrichales bacterium]|nr:hypothetical protein [Thiotrichales bacterium]
LAQTDLSMLDEHKREQAMMEQLLAEAVKPFDLSRDTLIRGTLLRLKETEHVLLLTMHHIISDGWSLGVLFRELGDCYAAFSRGEQPRLAGLPIQYADFAVWQRQWLNGKQLHKQQAYWHKQLAGLQALDLPIDKVRPAMQTYDGAHALMMVDAKLRDQLAQLSKDNGVTLFMTLLSVYMLVMHRYSGQDDIVIGSPIANRNRAELEGLIAFFVNMLVMRVDCSGNPDFRTFLQRVSESAMGAYEHQDIPFERLVETLNVERDPSRNPLFQIHFALQNSPLEPLQLEGLMLEPVIGEAQVTRFDLECHIWNRAEEGLQVAFVYNTNLFNDDTIRRMQQHFANLLAAVVAQPDTAIDLLPMLGRDEKDRMLQQWNQTDRDYALDIPLPQQFEAQVERSPQAVALEMNALTFSYRELDERANQLAHYLRDNGVNAGSLVGVFMQRSPEMVIALYAILKAGAAYVPLDPEYPQERLRFMQEETGLTVILTQKKLQKDLPATESSSGTGNDITIVCVDSQWPQIAQCSQQRLPPSATADDTAYVIYTSGSTGQPKGVMNSHRGIVNRLLWMQESYSLQAD